MKIKGFVMISGQPNINFGNLTQVVDKASGDGGDVKENDVQNLLNDTDSELSSLSHLDDPNQLAYILGGVIIAMVLVGVIIILVAVTINKLRKREETSSPVNVEAPQPQVVPTEQQHQPVVAYRQTQTAWRFPPLPPQPHIYSAHNHDALVPVDKAGLKGFKKQFSGRFKRLVSRKNEPTPVIPPELKPQLKTIYVY